MKHLTNILCAFGLLVVLLAGCNDDIASAGAGALTKDEEVRVCARTFANMCSRSDSIQEFTITQTPDSFLLGEVNTSAWATIKADLLTQFACPSSFTYPANSQVDSITLMMTYTSWFAEGNSPLRISVYELDKETFDYDSTYSSNVDISKYWSGNTEQTHAVIDDQIVVAAKPNDSIYSSTESKYYPIIRFKMNPAFVQKFNNLKTFPSQREFNNFFKGLYLTTTWGASTALYVDNITMAIHYHYPYTTKSASGADSTVINTDAKYLYANSEVRQINRYSFPNKDKVIQAMQTQADEVNYVVSPGYVYTVIDLPLAQYVDTIIRAMTREDDRLQPYINKALMRVNVLNAENTSSSSDKWADPASNMLLIRRDSLPDFFTNHNLPSSDYCVLSSFTQSIDSNYTTYYHYDFDISTLLYNEVHRKLQGGEVPNHFYMVLVPVHVEYTTSSSSISVSQVNTNQTITYTEIRSAQFISDPLNIDVVFSGFTINSLH